MGLADITPIRTDPATVADPDRRRAHARRYDAQRAADSARCDAVDAMTRNGIPHAEAARLVDELIMAVRRADALRLEYANGHLRNDWVRDNGVFLGSVEFLYTTAHAYPVQNHDGT